MYEWLVTLHVLGLLLFLGCHAVSMWVAFRVRGESDRAVVSALLRLSVRSSQAMYPGLILLGIGGLGAAASAGLLLVPWVVASYVVFVIVFVVMSAVAGTYYHPLRTGLDGTATVPRLSDEEFMARLDSRRPEALLLIGVGGLGLLTILMSVKPALW